ncbi:thermonuclease family protein [Alkalihalobacillus sp. BA299]|uniref:thermonuclease family protein n=1 Tax=Alkalihalobacillus sp. BA299 TaxID=2815938 RepID=UPI001ADA34BC|nr:thermonuclease family protein [Alkalihalobacillus sp. BA299]
MKIGKILAIVFLITLLSACAPRVSDEVPTDTNKNLLEDAIDVVGFGEKLNEEVGDTVEDTVDDTVESTITNFFGETVGKFIGDKVGDVAGKAAGTAVKKSLGEDIFNIKNKIESITGEELSNDTKLKNAVVHSCYDGDTCDIEFLDEDGNGNGKIITTRILNLDTPEIKEGHLFTKEAREFARKILVNQTVVIEISEKAEPFDKYSRLLAYIWVGDHLYEELVIKNGLGIVRYVIEPDTKYASFLREVEKVAKDKKIGVWSVPGLVKDGNNGYDKVVK